VLLIAASITVLILIGIEQVKIKYTELYELKKVSKDAPLDFLYKSAKKGR
jgi:hypothetical protein